MLSNVAIAVMLLVSGQAVAAPDFNPEYPVRNETRYISWCEDTKIITEDVRGNLVVQSDCRAIGKVCKAHTVIRPHFSIVVAGCE